MTVGTRVGMLTPSSNTCLEPVTYRMLVGAQNVSAHFNRISVTRISLDDEDSAQFDLKPMTAAARLLADAKVDSLMWNGTAGSWLGPSHDRGMVDAIEAETGIPTGTSTLALLDALHALGVRRLGLVTPYTGEVSGRITRTYAGDGIEVVADVHLGMTDNEAFGRVSSTEVAEMVRRAATSDVDAVAIVCTNLNGASAAAELEEELGLPVLDSVAVTLWKALRLAGSSLPIHGWGRLLAGGMHPPQA